MFNLNPSKTNVMLAARGGPVKSKLQSLSVQFTVSIRVNICTVQSINNETYGPAHTTHYQTHGYEVLATLHCPRFYALIRNAVNWPEQSTVLVIFHIGMTQRCLYMEQPQWQRSHRGMLACFSHTSCPETCPPHCTLHLQHPPGQISAMLWVERWELGAALGHII